MDQVKVNIRDFGKPKVVPLGERCPETLPLDDPFLTHAFKDNPCNTNVTIPNILLIVDSHGGFFSISGLMSTITSNSAHIGQIDAKTGKLNHC